LATQTVVATAATVATNVAAAATNTAGVVTGSVAANGPLVILVVVVHVILALGLIVFVLLHSGKGTGLSSMFGGMSSAASGTSIIEKNLDRITIGLAIGWAVTSVLLMMLYRAG
jgi:preprotein translocase subunit SecG